jgi:hypothetical protein
MISRIFAAGIGVLGIATMAAPVDTSARPGGFVAASSLGARSFVRPSIATPFSAHRFRREGMRQINGFHMSREGERQSPGSPWWGYASYLSSYYPSEYAAPYGGGPVSLSDRKLFRAFAADRNLSAGLQHRDPKGSLGRRWRAVNQHYPLLLGLGTVVLTG